MKHCSRKHDLQVSLVAAVIIGIAATMLVDIKGKDGANAPLTYVPADAPYVIANLDTPDTPLGRIEEDHATTNWQDLANDTAMFDSGLAKLMTAVMAEMKGKSLKNFAIDAGLRIHGQVVIYGLGLSPVFRAEISDPVALTDLVSRIERTSSTPLDTVALGGITYRRYIAKKLGIELTLAMVGEQVVLALLPAGSPEATLKLALGLNRPEQGVQQKRWPPQLIKSEQPVQPLIARVDIGQMKTMVADNSDPLLKSMRIALQKRAEREAGDEAIEDTEPTPSCRTTMQDVVRHIEDLSARAVRTASGHQGVTTYATLAEDIARSVCNGNDTHR